MNIVGIIQARMGSTRLPGKVLKKVLDKPLLEYQVERIKRSSLIDKMVIATTTKEDDDSIIQFCRSLNLEYYRGSEEDVLTRYFECAKTYHADLIVRLTSDCPIIDPAVIDKVIQCYLDHNFKYHYVSNTLQRTYPRGMDTEVFSYKVLDEAQKEASTKFEREHVTPFLKNHPERYQHANVSYKEDQSKHRWTVDTVEDFLLIKKIIENLYPANPNFTLEDVLILLKKYPKWVLINQHIKQKKN